MKKKILNDFIYSIIASAFPILVLQFLVLPLTAIELTAGEYGLLIALISWVNMISLTLGNVLNNVRLVKNESYEQEGLSGDFNILLLLFLLINILGVSIGIVILSNNINFLNQILLILTSVFLLLKGYLVVELRLTLKFKLILYDGFIMVMGYILGFILFKLFDEWSLIYFTSSIMSLIYILYKTKLINEPFKKTIKFNSVRFETFILLASVLLNSATVYLDKVMLLPLLGGSAVTIYYIASIMGKTFSLILNPISNVILSYLSRMKSLKNNLFIAVFGVSSLIGTLSYFIVIYVSEIVLYVIYPDYAAQALLYLPITVLTAIIIAIIGILNPILLKFRNMKWQLLINGIYLVSYIILSLVLLHYFDLLGFCYGLLIAAIIKLILTLIVYKMSNEKSAKINIGNKESI